MLPAAPVSIIWSPLPGGSPRVKGNFPGNYWPGRRWVDWVGTDFYSQYPVWKDLNRFYAGKQWKGKPVAINEWAVYGGDEPRFVKQLIAWIVKRPRVRMLVYYQGFGSRQPLRPAPLPAHDEHAAAQDPPRQLPRERRIQRRHPAAAATEAAETAGPNSPLPDLPMGLKRPNTGRLRPIGSVRSGLCQESLDRGGQTTGFAFDLLPGAPRHSPARKLKALLAPPVVLERRVGVVKATTVSFDDEARIAPQKVRHQAHTACIESDVDLGSGNAGSLAHTKELPLQLTPGPLRIRAYLVEQHPQAGNAAAPPATIDEPS